MDNKLLETFPQLGPMCYTHFPLNPHVPMEVEMAVNKFDIQRRTL